MRLLYRSGVAAGILGMLLAAGPARAQSPGYAESIQSAKTLMLAGQPQEARALLESLADRYRNSNDVDFLLGLLAIDQREYGVAISHFRAVLVREPKAVRVRLELGRAFYLKRDYDNAFRQFQFARAGHLSPGVSATIDRFLSAIRREKSWSYNFGIALAPDTNINNGTSARDVLLFGLPFELNDETRRKSGVGLAVEAGGEFAPRISANARLRLGGALQRREYKGGDFDDMIVALYAGPRLTLKKWDLSATVTGFQRRFGGRRLSDGVGAKVDTTYYKGSRTALSLSLSAQQIRYPDYPLQTGVAYSGWAGVTRTLSPASSLNARIGISRKTARAPELASWSESAAVGYYRDLPRGFTIYAEPSFTLSRYDATDPFFEARRKDRLLEMRVSVLNRRILVRGFTPRVTFSWTRRNSSIDLFDFTQRRLEAGFTSAF